MKIPVIKKIIVAIVIFLLASYLTEAQVPKVYLGGYYKENNYSAGGNKACYWVDGNMFEIDGESVDVITVYNGKVYVAGIYRTYYVDVNHPLDSGILEVYRYWIDGNPYELPGCVNVNSIIVDNNNVYVVGSYEEKRELIRTYWLNGVQQKCPSDGSIRDIFIINGVLYIAGFYTVVERQNDTTDYACYWIGGVRYELPNSKNFLAHGIKVVNGHKYIGAVDYQNRLACYWIDDKQYTFSNYEGVVNKEFVVSTGNIVKKKEKNYWVNGVHNNFKASSFFGECFTYAHGKVYIVGAFRRLGGTASYWIDAERFDISSSNITVNIKTIYVPE
jgi:hypothetical protein